MDVLESIRTIFLQDSVIEIRALGKLKNAVQSGYFKNHERLAEVAIVLDSAAEHKGIYFTLNSVNPVLYARSPDKMTPPRTSVTLTSDADIVRRRWLPVDFDPVRPADISSSREEHQAAMDRADLVRETMASLGWPEPIVADSGNGAHLLYGLDLPNDEKSTALVERVLRALDKLYSDDIVKIDVKNYNASRIWKAYGTTARKGANVADRPWRKSRILEVPEKIEPVSVGLMESFAGPVADKPVKKNSNVEPVDVEQWLARYGLDVAKRKTVSNGGTIFVLDRCPWNSGHTDRSAWVIQFGDGGVAAGCHHDGCAGLGWNELRRLYEPVEDVDEPIIPPAKKTRVKEALTQLQIGDVADIDYNPDGSVKSCRFNASRAADAVCQYLEILATPDAKIWVYENGYYKPDGNVVIDQVLDQVAGVLYTINAGREVMKKVYLRSLVEFEELDANPFLLCVKNGVINLETGEFLSHSPEYKITLPCPVTYDPQAKADLFIDFLKESCSNDDDRLTLIDWLVACACTTEFEFLLFLTGHGGNGKHVYEAVIQNLFGAGSTEAIGAEELVSSRFALGFLWKMRTCIFTESNFGKVAVDLFKKVSGNDWLSSDIKNKDARLRFRAFTQLIFDSNTMQEFVDDSPGFSRRFTRVNMPYSFVDEPEEGDPLQKKKDPDLEKKLVSPESLSGILNLIVRRAPMVIPKRTIHRRANDLEEYAKQSRSASDFVEQFIDFEPEFRDLKEYQIGTDYLYDKFKIYQKYIIGASIPKKAFSAMIGKANGEPSKTIRVMGMAMRGFRGLAFEEDKFNDCIKELERTYNNESLHCNDSLPIKKENRYNVNDSGRTCCNDVTNVTIILNFVYSGISESIGVRAELDPIVTKIVTKTKNQQLEASYEGRDDPKCNDSNRYTCQECGVTTDVTYEIGSGKFLVKMCRSCFEKHMDDVTNVFDEGDLEVEDVGE